MLFRSPDKNLVNRVYSHKLSDLLSIAGLALELKQALLANPVIDTYWAVVEQWGVESRYESIDPFLASAMNDAVSHPVNGVFRWITSRW